MPPDPPRFSMFRVLGVLCIKGPLFLQKNLPTNKPAYDPVTQFPFVIQLPLFVATATCCAVAMYMSDSWCYLLLVQLPFIVQLLLFIASTVATCHAVAAICCKYKCTLLYICWHQGGCHCCLLHCRLPYSCCNIYYQHSCHYLLCSFPYLLPKYVTDLQIPDIMTCDTVPTCHNMPYSCCYLLPMRWPPQAIALLLSVSNESVASCCKVAIFPACHVVATLCCHWNNRYIPYS